MVARLAITVLAVAVVVSGFAWAGSATATDAGTELRGNEATLREDEDGVVLVAADDGGR